MEVLKVLIVFILGEPFEIAAGYAFGIWEGLLLCTIGISIGSIVVFLLVRRFGSSVVEVFFNKHYTDVFRLNGLAAIQDGLSPRPMSMTGITSKA